MIAGGTTVLLISASDCERGVLTESDELFTALSRAVIVALITGGLGNAVGTASAVVNKSVEGFVRYLIVGALTLGVSGVSTAITDTIYDQEWSWERALKSGIFDVAMAMFAMGIADVSKAKAKTINNYDDLVQEAANKKALDILENQSKKSAGPCLSTIYDPVTDKIAYGQNFKTTPTGREQYYYWLENEADPLIRKLVNNYESKIKKRRDYFIKSC